MPQNLTALCWQWQNFHELNKIRKHKAFESHPDERHAASSSKTAAMPAADNISSDWGFTALLQESRQETGAGEFHPVQIQQHLLLPKIIRGVKLGNPKNLEGVQPHPQKGGRLGSCADQNSQC